MRACTHPHAHMHTEESRKDYFLQFAHLSRRRTSSRRNVSRISSSCCPSSWSKGRSNYNSSIRREVDSERIRGGR